MCTPTWAGVLDDDRQSVVVAEAPGGLVGVAQAGPARDADLDASTGQLAVLYVVPGAWDTGTGRALHDAALARLTSAGFTSAVVWMLATNDRARRFYLRRGWVRDRALRLQQFGGRVVLDHRFTRTLAP